MKRVAGIGFGLLFLISTMGFAVASHYCHGYAVDTSIVLTGKAGSCCCDETADDSNCCENELNYFKVDEDYVTTGFETLDFSHTATRPLYTTCITRYTKNHYYGVNYHAPPPLQKDIILLVQSFLI